MATRRWWLWLGPPVVVLAIGLALTYLQPRAEAGGRRTPSPLGVCAASPVTTDAAGSVRRDVAVGSWWHLSERLDQAGTIIGRQLAIGRGGATGLTLDVGVESAASGPVGGVVVVVSDTGRRSTISLVSAVQGCTWLAHETQDLVRGAILDPSDGSVLAHVLDRASRADLGTWRFGAPGALTEPGRVAPPILAVAGGPVWATDLRVDEIGDMLGVQSCGESSCLTRVFDLRAGGALVATLEGEQGGLIGFARGRLVTWNACRNLPCGVTAWDVAGSARRQLIPAAQAAALSADGQYLVATLDASTGRTLRMDLGGGVQRLVRGPAPGERVLDAGAAATSGLQVRPDEVALGSNGAIPRPFRPAAAEVLP